MPLPDTLPTDDAGRVDLKGLTREQLVGWLTADLGATPRQAHNVYAALWRHGSASVEGLRNVGRPLRERLAEVAYVSMLEPDLVLKSVDGTRKFLWKLADGLTVESVLIPDGDRVTLCMSSQVGCAMKCSFCLTGDLGLKRHMTAGEIAGQALQVGKLAAGEGVRITNLVFMGMGEPLHNLPQLIPALTNCLDDHGLNFSHRKVTVSTVGLVPKMAELAAALPVNLAVSVNATTEAQRRQIMPITRKYSLAELVQGMRSFPLPPGKRITVEYVMLGGFNDTLDDAARLADLVEGIPIKINLIPYNENPDRDIRRPADDTVAAWQAFFAERTISCAVRTTRGLDISAACGQLGKARMQAMDRGWLDEARRQAHGVA